MSELIVVTGGTGFIGAQIVETLHRAGRAVRVLSRGGVPSSIDKLPVERVSIDLASATPTALAAALTDATGIIHAAGYVSRDPAESSKMMALHVEATRSLLAAVDQSAVQTFVLVSTSGTIAVSRNAEPIPDESAAYPIELVAAWPYYLSKIYEERLVLAWAKTCARRVVVCNPSLLLGAGDSRGSSTTDIVRFLRGQIPTIPPGGLSFVDVRDCADAIVKSLDHGEHAQRYLLGGTNWTFAEFLARLGRIAKVSPPRVRLPSVLVRGAASLIEAGYAWAGRTSPVDRASVEMSELYWYCNADRARRVLQFNPRDPAETLDECVRDVRRRIF